MPRVSTGAARIWLARVRPSRRPAPYPAPPGTWHELFAAIEVEAAQHALKAVRLDIDLAEASGGILR
jgi:hypothetical protein